MIIYINIIVVSVLVFSALYPIIKCDLERSGLSGSSAMSGDKDGTQPGHLQ